MNGITNFSIKQPSVAVEVTTEINPVRKVNTISYSFTDNETITGEAVANGIFTLYCSDIPLPAPAPTVTLPTVEELANSSLYASSTPKVNDYIKFSVLSIFRCDVINPYGGSVSITGNVIIKNFNLVIKESGGSLVYDLIPNEL